MSDQLRRKLALQFAKLRGDKYAMPADYIIADGIMPVVQEALEDARDAGWEAGMAASSDGW